MARSPLRSPSEVGAAWRGKRRRQRQRHDRRHPCQIRLTDAEWSDWQRIAEAWRVPVATALWAVLAERLAVWRRCGPELGPVGLEIAATAATLGLVARPRGAPAICPLLASGPPAMTAHDHLGDGEA